MLPVKSAKAFEDKSINALVMMVKAFFILLAFLLYFA
jgi:hypothetical protein